LFLLFNAIRNFIITMVENESCLGVGRNIRNPQKIDKLPDIRVIMYLHADELNDNPNLLEVAYVEDRSGCNQ
jgi:hypothetical protein